MNKAKSVDRTIAVIGIGSCGESVIKHMLSMEIPGAELVVMDTDKQALDNSNCPNKVYLLTNGRGESTQAHVEIVRQTAEENRAAIVASLNGARVIFLVSGTGGATGAGVIPVLGSIAKELGILVVCVVAYPFQVEGFKRKQHAGQEIEKLLTVMEGLVIAPSLPNPAPDHDALSLRDAYNASELVLCRCVHNLIGYVNVTVASTKSRDDAAWSISLNDNLMNGMCVMALSAGFEARRSTASLDTMWLPASFY